MSDKSVTETLGATTKVLGTGGFSFPLTVTLNSSDATRKIELSTNGGVNYFEPTIDITDTNFLVIVLNANVSRLRFTGLATDTVTFES